MDMEREIILRAEQSRAEQSRAEQSRAEQSIHVRFAGFDILKFLCSFLIVCIHCPLPGEVGQWFTALTRIAVPIFFMISGYYFDDMQTKKRTSKQVKKIFVLLIATNCFYLAWKTFLVLLKGNSVSAYLKSICTLMNFANFILFNDSPIQSHLWYLGAILYVLLIMVVLSRFYLMKIVFILTPILLIGDIVFGKYSVLLFGREFPIIFVRNFLFVGIPYFTIGMGIRWLIKSGRTVSVKGMLILIFVFSTTTVLERFFLITVHANATRDHYISTTFLTIAVFMFFIEKYKGRKIGKLEKTVAMLGQKYSIGVYIIHPVFITVLAVIMRKLGMNAVYSFVAPMVVFFISYIAVLIFMIIIVIWTEKAEY